MSKKTIIIGPAHPYRGGISDTNESLCTALNNCGVNSSIITFKLQYPKFLFPGKTQFRKNKQSHKPLKIERLINTVNPINWILVARKINKLNPDLVIVRYWLSFLAPCLGTIARLINKNTKLIALCDNIKPHENRLGDKLFTNYFLNSFNGFITMSDKVRAELLLFSIKPQLTYPHPINSNLEGGIDKITAKKHLKLNPQKNYILFFGLVRKYKGLDLTLKAIQLISEQLPNTDLIIAGEFYDNKDSYISYISTNHLTDRVHIIDHFIEDKELKFYFSACDIISLTYNSASQSGIAPMAMHFNRPILATNVGGLPEVVKNFKTGYLCNKDPQEIANCLLDFFQKNRFKEFSKNIKHDKKSYSWDVFARKILVFEKSL